MSSFDLSNLSKVSSTSPTQVAKTTNPKAGSTSLELTDFLKLIVAQFQNQDPENAASTTDMMNMLVQMSVVQAVTTVTDSASMLYTSSLVGKEVTVGEYDKTGKLKEVVGTVTATGSYNGEPVIFVDGVKYKVSDIMAIGRLPEEPKPEEPKPEEPEMPAE
jgi:flagellar basal-body rod modification protein FlgD